LPFLAYPLCQSNTLPTLQTPAARAQVRRVGAERAASAALGYTSAAQLRRHRLVARLLADEARIRQYRQREAARRGDIRLPRRRAAAGRRRRRGLPRAAAAVGGPPEADGPGLRGPEGLPEGAGEGLEDELREAARGDVANAGDRVVRVA
jgi:hypothetical protein